MTMLSVGSHYDEETLIRVAEAAVEIEDRHLAECDDCRTAVDEYRDLLSCMSDEVIWDQRPIDDTPNPRTIATLRAFVEDMHREDADAEPLVAELLAGSREEWMPRLMADAKYRTAGVVRKLIAMTDRAVEQSPADYVAIALLATEVASHLFTGDRGTSLTKLKAATQREAGYSHYVVGEIDKAHEETLLALELLTNSPLSEFEKARVDLLRATIYSRCERTETALNLVASASTTFAEFGQRKRVADALWLKANILAERRAFREALQVVGEIRTDFNDMLDESSRAGLLLNEGYYRREIGDFSGALHALTESLFMFEELGAPVSVVRAKFNAAVVLQAAGQSAAAAERFERAIEDFTALGMTGAATLAGLHLAEVRLQQNRYDEVEVLCRRVVEQLTKSAVAYRERALVAISLLREASVQRRVSPSMIRQVREYVARLPYEPQLLFASAPPNDNYTSG